MRLLQYNNDGDFSLTEFFESGIPNYAILSHRWGAEEVTFKDLINCTSKNKAGYRFKREDFSIAFSLFNISDVEHFVTRKTELLKMHNLLNSDGSRRVVVLYSLGGIGKTQLSAGYTKRHKDNYSGIFWLNIKDEDSLKQSFVKVAK
ncbi:hypothetical protein ACEPPN_006130 [Leptodophora sp. 'Broadleaf-Isolate-01']